MAKARFKGTFALLLLVVLLGGYIYVYEYRGGVAREAAQKAEKQIWRLDPAAVVRVELKTTNGVMIAEHSAAAPDDNAARWIITAPRRWQADKAELDRLVAAAATLSQSSVVTAQTADLARYGLESAPVELRLTTKAGKVYDVAFGDNNPSGNSTYARVGQEIFLVAEAAAASFNRKAEEFRNHKVLSFDRAGVNGVILRNPKGVIELEKDRDDRWWFKGPEKREAGGPEVRTLLNALDLGKIPEFFDDNPADYLNAALVRPQIDVVLTFGPDKALPLQRLVIGPEKSHLRKKSAAAGAATEVAEKSAGTPVFLARDDSRDELFFVSQELVDKLSLSADDLRDKALVSFQRWDVDGILLENANGTFDFVKTDGDWFLRGTKRQARWDEINAIMDALEKPVRRWIDQPGALAQYGLAPDSASRLRVVLRHGATVIAECVLGQITTEGIYAKVSGDSAVKIADPDGIPALERTASDYMAAPADASVPQNATKK